MFRSITSGRTRIIVGLLALFAIPFGTALAGGHKAKGTQFAPVYLQQAPVATQVYSAPVATQVLSAPVMTQVFSAPAPTQAYSAPAATTYFTNNTAGGAVQVGNAPVAGAKISAIAREDILSELRKEAKDAGTDGSMRERRKALRDSARTKYAEEIGVDESELEAADTQDIDNVVNLILHPQATNSIQTGFVQPSQAPYSTTLVPYQAPQQATMFVQPMVPVQLLVPIQPKHHWLHK